MAKIIGIIGRVHDVDARYSESPSKRRYHMEILRTEYYETFIAGRLAAMPEYAGRTSAELSTAARQILTRRGRRSSPNDPTVARRADHEERLAVSAGVAWHKLLKAEGVAAARPRRGNSGLTSLTGTAAKLRRLSSLRSNPWGGAAVLCEYAAKHARHLSDVCEYAKALNPKSVPSDLESAIALLLAITTRR